MISYDRQAIVTQAIWLWGVMAVESMITTPLNDVARSVSPNSVFP